MPKLSKGELAKDRRWGEHQTAQKKSVVERALREKEARETAEVDAIIAMATVSMSMFARLKLRATLLARYASAIW